MAAKPDTRNYDILKGVVTAILLIIIAILLLQGGPAREAEGSPEATFPAATLPVADLAMPAINTPLPGERGNVSLSGTGQPGATVELWAGDVKLGDVVVGEDGTWSWDGTLELGDSYQLSARTVDASGQMLNEAGIGLARAEPVVEIALPTINSPILGEGGSLSLSGTGQPGATIELWAGDIKLGDVIVGDDGAWSWDGTLDPGDYQLSARTVDASGQMVNEAPALALNMPAPVVEIALPTLNPPTLGEGGSVSLSGTGQPGATIELWAGDLKLEEVLVGEDGTWSWDGTLDAGDYQLSVRTVDASGQMLNEAPALAFTVASEVAPVTPVLAEPQVDAEGTVTLSGTAEPGTTIELVEDGAVVGTAQVQDDGNWTFAYKAATGAHQLAARSQAEPDVASAEVSIEVPTPASTDSAEDSAASGEGQGYVVQRGDCLSALAEQFYGDWKLWRLIFETTNERAAEDPTFHIIENPRLIRPGWKLWIPAQ